MDNSGTWAVPWNTTSEVDGAEINRAFLPCRREAWAKLISWQTVLRFTGCVVVGLRRGRHEQTDQSHVARTWNHARMHLTIR
jgi:hypothetical protein